jgi:hypothetical protein
MIFIRWFLRWLFDSMVLWLVKRTHFYNSGILR